MKTASQYARQNYPEPWPESQRIACAMGYCQAVKEIYAELQKRRMEAVVKEEAEGDYYYSGMVEAYGSFQDFLAPFMEDELTYSKYKKK